MNTINTKNPNKALSDDSMIRELRKSITKELESK